MTLRLRSLQAPQYWLKAKNKCFLSTGSKQVKENWKLYAVVY